MSADENTLRSDLEAAFEVHTTEGAPKEGGSAANTPEPVRAATPAEGKEVPQPGTEQPVASKEDGVEAGRERNPDGTFKPAGQAKPEASKEGTPAVGKEEQQPAKGPAVSGLNPPVGWKPVAREHWNTIPKAAQEEIIRREQETSKALSHSVNARRLFDEFSQVVGPYMPLIQAQNSTPMQAVKNLMNTAAGLTMGSAQQKAQIVREIIQNYGVDIETLDKVLAGAPINPQSATVNAQNTPPAWAAPLFQFVNGVQQTQKQREQQINQEAEQQTQAFAASHEFYEDVREDMADFMEFAAKRGRAMTLQQAYDRACQENSDVKAILDQREAAKRSSAPGGVARARAAASTVVGQPRNSPVPAAPADRRGDIMAAWEAQESR